MVLMFLNFDPTSRSDHHIQGKSAGSRALEFLLGYQCLLEIGGILKLFKLLMV